MKKMFVALAVLSIVSVTAYGKVGVGYTDFDKALSVKYWMEDYGFQGTVYAYYQQAEESQAESFSEYDISVYFLYPLLKKDNLWFNAVLGGSYVVESNIGYVNKDRNSISVTLALSPELYVRENLSLECMFGVRYAMYGDKKVDDLEPTISDKHNVMTTFGFPMSLSGGLAFHYYFPEVASTASGTSSEEIIEMEEEEIEE